VTAKRIRNIQRDKDLPLPGTVTDVIQEFAQSLAGRKPSTIRLYVAGARAAVKAVGAGVSECGSRAELLSLLQKSRPKKGARVGPFLRFLEWGSVGADGDARVNQAVSLEDSRGIQYWVVQTMVKRLRSDKNPSIATRRDMALVASLCSSAPAQLPPELRANPLKWPQSCLQVGSGQVLLWGQKIEEPAFALSLRYWHAWRDRLARPDQTRLYRKHPQWGRSDLLFPGPRGGPLGRSALHNTLRRLIGVGEGSRVRLTPQKVRAAFLGSSGPLGAGQGGDAVAPL
jgi:hypothetical protein